MTASFYIPLAMYEGSSFSTSAPAITICLFGYGHLGVKVVCHYSNIFFKKRAPYNLPTTQNSESHQKPRKGRETTTAKRSLRNVS